MCAARNPPPPSLYTDNHMKATTACNILSFRGCAAAVVRVVVAGVRVWLTWSSGGAIGCTGGPPESAVVSMSAGATGMRGGGSGFVSISGKGSGTVAIIGATAAGALAGATACVWSSNLWVSDGASAPRCPANGADVGVGGRTAAGGDHACRSTTRGKKGFP